MDFLWYNKMKMKIKVPDIISEEELKNLLKMEIQFTGKCYSCPLSTLKTSCARTIRCLCGKTPTNCSEAIILLRGFLNKFKQNKI